MKRNNLVGILQRQLPPDFEICWLGITPETVTVNAIGLGDKVHVPGKPFEVKILMHSEEVLPELIEWRSMTDQALLYLRHTLASDVQGFYDDPDQSCEGEAGPGIVQAQREAALALGVDYDDLVKQEANEFEIRRVNEYLEQFPDLQVRPGELS